MEAQTCRRRRRDKQGKFKRVNRVHGARIKKRVRVNLCAGEDIQRTTCKEEKKNLRINEQEEKTVENKRVQCQRSGGEFSDVRTCSGLNRSMSTGGVVNELNMKQIQDREPHIP